MLSFLLHVGVILEYQTIEKNKTDILNLIFIILPYIPVEQWYFNFLLV